MIGMPLHQYGPDIYGQRVDQAALYVIAGDNQILSGIIGAATELQAEHDLLSAIPHGPAYLAIIMRGQDCLSVGTICFDPDMAVIDGLVTKLGSRNSGRATTVLHALEDVAVLRSIPRIELTHTGPTRGFFSKNGYMPSETPRVMYKDLTFLSSSRQ